MIGADVHRIPLRHFLGREQDHVPGQPHRRRRRKHIGAARQIFLDDVVLGRAGEFLPRHALLVGERDIERKQPRGGGVDGHRRVHLAERDAVEQNPHVADMRDRHADLADFAFGLRMVAVVAGLGRQIEGDREAGLPLAQVLPVQLVRRLGVGVARIGAEHPGFIALRLVALRLIAARRFAFTLGAQRLLAARLVVHLSIPHSGAPNVTRFLLQRNMRLPLPACGERVG